MTDNYQRIATAIHYLRDHFKQPPSLADLANSVGLSPFHMQKLFTQYTGISPKRFCQFMINNEAKQHLLSSHDSLLTTSEKLGLSNPSRLHDLMVSVDALTPNQYRQRCSRLSISYGEYPTPFGRCLLATTRRGICRLEFIMTTRHEALNRLRDSWPDANLYHDPRAGENIIQQIFFNARIDRPLSLYLKGTNFQLKVWQALLNIPHGYLTSYSVIASRAGEQKACRAVGSAVGANPIAYLIPCHRVLRSDGGMGGYRWGEDRKLMMLARELVEP